MVIIFNIVVTVTIGLSRWLRIRWITIIWTLLPVVVITLIHEGRGLGTNNEENSIEIVKINSSLDRCRLTKYHEHATLKSHGQLCFIIIHYNYVYYEFLGHNFQIVTEKKTNEPQT